MKEAADFLQSLARAVSAMALYGEGHPSRERAVDEVDLRARLLQEEDAHPGFTFLGGEVIHGGRPLRELREWGWAERLARAGIQRLELTGPMTRGDLEVFLEHVFEGVHGRGAPSAEARHERPTAIRFGLVTLADGRDEEPAAPLTTATLGMDLADEWSTVEWLHGELEERRRLHMLEAEALVRSLSVAMHGDQEFLIPLLRLKEFDQYTTTHALNVSVLSMALAEYIGLGPSEVRTFGIAGLLHDIGKIEVPRAILTKPGRLTDEERRIMNRHPVEGARLILETEDRLDLAAVVAYEHHIRADGGGYPSFRYRRPCHQASDLVHVCDVFDALRTDRPYRAALERDRALELIEEGAGPEFDPVLARAFARMVRQWGDRLREVEAPSAEVADPAASGEGEGGERQ